MLKHLSVVNYALIKKLELDLNKGLTVLTGETGSGKSIILGALGLVLGERADLKSLAIPENKCIIEATFIIENRHLSFFEVHDLDYAKETIFRREISATGKSRAFINDTPVNLQQLKELGSQLVEIHSQDQNSILSQSKFQFEILDSFAENLASFEAYQHLYANYLKAKREFEEIKNRDQQSQADLDYFTFQYNELKDSNLDYIDKESLENEKNTITHAGDIGELMERLTGVIEEGEEAILDRLNTLAFDLSKRIEFHQDFPELSKRLESVIYELQDISNESSKIKDHIDLDPQRAQDIEEILSDLYALESKHRVNSVEELKAIRDDLSEKLLTINGLEEELEKAEKNLSEAKSLALKSAQGLHNVRIQHTEKLQKHIEATFKKLGLEYAQIRISLSETEEIGPYGKEKIAFEFCANPGGNFSPIEKVASGGEKSRVLLALKKIFSDLSYFPTLILDEIDSGVSGEIGKKIGDVMQEMSQNTQILTITHLPQIAGMGEHHFKVKKVVEDQQTRTEILSMSEEERVDELAEMLSGKTLSEAARENAKELLRG